MDDYHESEAGMSVTIGEWVPRKDGSRHAAVIFNDSTAGRIIDMDGRFYARVLVDAEEQPVPVSEATQARVYRFSSAQEAADAVERTLTRWA